MHDITRSAKREHVGEGSNRKISLLLIQITKRMSNHFFFISLLLLFLLLLLLFRGGGKTREEFQVMCRVEWRVVNENFGSRISV